MGCNVTVADDDDVFVVALVGIVREVERARYHHPVVDYEDLVMQYARITDQELNDALDDR